jgi:hypothetical protein
MKQDQQENAMSQIVAKCWADETFKQQLIADPKATLAAAGYPVPEHISINVVENTNTYLTVVIPINPQTLSDQELDNVAGGQSTSFTKTFLNPVNIPI